MSYDKKIEESEEIDKLNMKAKMGFQSLLYYKFVVHKTYRVDTVAEKMGLSSDTLYRYVRGDRPFPIDRLSDLVNATGDFEYLEYFNDRCGYSVIPKIKDKTTTEIMTQIAEIFLSATENRKANK